MALPNRYLVPNVNTSTGGNSNVGILGANTVALIAGSLCNKSNAPVAVNVWIDPPGASANANVLYNLVVPANSTITCFGMDQKQFLLAYDCLWINCNVAGVLDFVVSTVEGL